LTIELEGAQYTGCLLFDDADFCASVCELLQNNCGMFIEAIGSLDLSPDAAA
jgi:hypothetical protein